MGAAVDIGEETTETGIGLPTAALCVRLFGPLRVESGGRAIALPPSRKVRALLGYLALAPRPVPRGRLCELLWDVASDPRGELRWCLTKLRGLFDAPGQQRLISDGERVGLDLSELDVDAVRFARAIEPALGAASIAELKLLTGMVEGELLEGLALERSPLFENWLASERQRFARWQVKGLLRLASLLPPDSEEMLDVLRKRLAAHALRPPGLCRSDDRAGGARRQGRDGKPAHLGNPRCSRARASTPRRCASPQAGQRASPARATRSRARRRQRAPALR